MDAYIQLAMVEKARRVFSTATDTFLSFPVLSPITMTAAAMQAIASPSTMQDLSAANDFARLVNFIPHDLVSTIDGGQTLWEIYADVLARAEVGEGFNDPQERQRYRAALDTLSTENPQGLREETPKYRAYRQYRDAWFVAQEDYRSRRLTGEADEAAREAWRQQEPILAARIRSVENDWTTLGYRAEVDAALAVVSGVTANNPQLRWQNWRNAFNPDLDMLTGPAGAFAPTGYSPVNLDEDAAWSQFELSSAEITGLASDAPAELRQALRDDPDPVTRVVFDYRSVALTRPWFSEAALTSRIWRMPAGAGELSDGAFPASGQCPAYTTALVLVRNLQIFRPSGHGRPQKGVSFHDPVTWKLPPRYITPREIPHPDDEALQWKSRTRVLEGYRRDHDATVLKPETAKVLVGLRERGLKTSLVTRLAGVTGAGVRLTAADHGAARVHDLIRTGRVLHDGPFIRDVNVADPGRPAADAAPATPPTGTDISILAFICKSLPKTPDPLPNLSWS